MKLLRLFAVGNVLLCLAAAPAYAAGDVDAGKARAEGVCAACHGAGGYSKIAQYPVLAGQVPGYIETQLAAFKSGARKNPVMGPMAAPLSAVDMANLNAYYASQKPQVGAVPKDRAKLARAGGKIFRGGYRPLSIAACMSCHGPGGHGIPPQFPRVSGQHAQYLEAQLLAFKSGARENEVMNPIAFSLSVRQIKALALYMSGLQ